ncbi:MAG: B12-binding domain-containing radical SAM protein [Desulfovibrio sp.]|jgi:radical SAM superfamily enzyme YgiQ (UPF0313 family)|nr:B12-binding domain-containing radical SAM protein [Desulfovibrio sp.]
MKKPPKIVLANPPFVRHGETGNFADIDELTAYMEAKTEAARVHGLKTAREMYPENFDLVAGVRAGSRWPHLTGKLAPDTYTPFPFLLAYASGNLKAHGFEARVIDSIASRRHQYGRFLAEVREHKPDIVVIETSQATEDIDLWLCRQIAGFAETALAGPHIAEATVNRLQAENPHIRYFLQGEYIQSAVRLAQTRKPGVYEPEVVLDMDALPFPDRDFPGADMVRDAWIPGMDWPQLQIWGSKGCPFKCTFCLWPQTVFQGRTAPRSPENIVAEIRECVARHGYRHIYFDDDTFNLGNERISRLCDLLKELGIPWGGMMRIDTSPLPLLEKMIACGCAGMKFGLESFDAKVLAGINKKLDPGKLFHTVSYLARKYPKLKLHLTTMRGLPGQSDTVHAMDLGILQALGFSNIGRGDAFRTYQVSTCIPYPGTALHAELKAAGTAA